MSLAPIDFIKQKYIKPNKITQDMLCASLNLGKKTISELYQHKRGFTVYTAKKFAKLFGLKPEFLLLKQIEYDLSKDENSYEEIVPFEIIKEDEKRENISKWILSIINNSISEESEHYSSDDLLFMLKNTDTSNKYHYAILTMFKEVDYSDVIEYSKVFEIDKSQLKKLYAFYKDKLNSEGIDSYEWLFK